MRVKCRGMNGYGRLATPTTAAKRMNSSPSVSMAR